MKELDSIKNNKKKSGTTTAASADKLSTVARIQLLIEERRNLVIGISAFVIIAVIGIFLLANYMKTSSEEKNNSASFALAKAQELFLANNYNNALYGDKKILVNNKPMLGLVEIVNKYDGTKPAQIAALYAGSCFINLNKTSEAVRYFSISSESESAIIKEGSFAGLAACAESQGKYSEAIDNYEKAIALSKMPGSRNRYQYFQGLCYEKLGQKEKAGKLYRDIVNENASEFAAYAKGGLSRIGMIIE